MTTLPPTQQQSLEFTTRHSFSYRDGANNKYHLKDSLEIEKTKPPITIVRYKTIIEERIVEVPVISQDTFERSIFRLQQTRRC